MLWKNRVGLPGTGIPHVWGNRTHPAECSNSSNISPTQPRRTKTCRSTGKAAGESKPEEVPTAFRVGRSSLQWILANEKSPPALPISNNIMGYVDDFDESRTKLANFFSILIAKSCNLH